MDFSHIAKDSLMPSKLFRLDILPLAKHAMDGTIGALKARVNIYHFGPHFGHLLLQHGESLVLHAAQRAW